MPPSIDLTILSTFYNLSLKLSCEISRTYNASQDTQELPGVIILTLGGCMIYTAIHDSTYNADVQLGGLIKDKPTTSKLYNVP
jgi:hypothetical protein